MNRQSIQIPDGIRYITQWTELQNIIPNKGKLILNKSLPDCGASTYFLSNADNVILASPRIEMLKSKAKKKDLNLFWYQPGMDMELSAYLTQQHITQRPVKIIVTYDSLSKVLQKINNIGDCQVVVDEMQCLIGDAAFKGDTVLQVVELLDKVPNVLYLSATVYPDDYLDNISFFKDLLYIKLEWPDSMTRPIQMQRIQMQSIRKQAREVIQKFKTLGYFETKMLGGVIQYAKEAVFFLNSVLDILAILKDNQLSASEVNIICSADAERKLKKKGYTRGEAPQKGEPHKTYTFVTKASFEGTDFYSTNAYTYIFCDPTLQNMALDLYIDVPQIMGRQRDYSNPFKYDATIFFKTTLHCDSFDEFQKWCLWKDNATNQLEGIYNSLDPAQQELLLGQYESAHANDGFSQNYLTVIKRPDGTKQLYRNTMVQIAEVRAWDIQQNQYSSEIRILASLQANGINCDTVITTNDEITMFANDFAQDNNFERRMALYCTYRFNHPDHEEMIEATTYIPIKYHLYYNTLGPEKIHSLSYKEAPIKNEILILQNCNNIENEIRGMFISGGRYKTADIKAALQGLYDKLGLKKRAKATDLLSYFEMKSVSVYDKEAKYNGYLLKSK